MAMLLRVNRNQGFREAESAAAVLWEFVDPDSSDGRPEASLKMVEDPASRARMKRNLKRWKERPLFPGSPIDAHKELRRLRGYDDWDKGGI
ncbi:hypothetical protein KFL_008090020 [Klebsormidium nitens]|uniref:Uncharacterized protein n=1 Tax=Klebsormidium nitens TaxID=105231 RepID=A0A1Y1IQP9_KLENI|nr:hypothetical protein KFL_008090020 [Klebsormidium nitens]|eukprot:GAQ91571.1 hypothetical protein KFL_008090020 [Klebsormidium nitens]